MTVPPGRRCIRYPFGPTSSLRPLPLVSTFRLCLQCGAEYPVEQRHCATDGSALQLKTTDDALIGKVIADRYHILELLGVGGMGRVYLAEHVALGRKSAVKVISPAYANSADAITRFNREAANASRINHPNIAQIYDFGESAGVLYLAMEFVEGEALSAMIERLGPLVVGRAANVTMQVADALGAAHTLGIVHRDLKPENIMIGRRHDGTDWVKVVDFGIAKTVEREEGSQTVTVAGVSLGTPEYMSPEQFAGERLDHRTDIYSLGLVLFNMLTGQLPYPTVTSKETLVRRLTSPPTPLAEARPDVGWPAGLQTALDRALAPEAGNRYGRVSDFAADVVRASERAPGAPRRALEPVTAPTSPPPVAATAPAPKRAAAPRPVPAAEQRSTWPVLLFLLLLVAGAVAAVRYQKQVQQAFVSMMPWGAETTAYVPPVAPTVIDSLPDVAVTPQGAASDSPSTGAGAAGRDSTTASPSTGAASSTAKDSAAKDALPPPSFRRKSTLRHPWLRVNGDSGESRDPGEGAGPDDVQRAQLDELQGHLAFGMRHATLGDVAQARVAFRDAVDEARGLKLADRTLSFRIDAMLRNAQRDAYHACQTAHSDTTHATTSNGDCGTLFGW